MTDTKPTSSTNRLHAVARYIREHADEALPLAHLAARAAMSPAHFQRSFKQQFGLSPKQYQDGHRMQRLRDALKAGESVTDAITDAGYSSTSRLYGEATRSLGMPPSAYRAGGRGEVIHYVARHTADPAWPGPVWGHSPAVPYAPAARDTLIAKLVNAR